MAMAAPVSSEHRLSRATVKNIYDFLGIAFATATSGAAHAGIAYAMGELSPAEVDQFTAVVAAALLTFKGVDTAEQAFVKFAKCGPRIQANIFTKMTSVIVNTAWKGLFVFGVVEAVKHWGDPHPAPTPIQDDVKNLGTILAIAVSLKEAAIAFARADRRIAIATVTETAAIGAVGYLVLGVAGAPALGAFAAAIVVRGLVGVLAQGQIAAAPEAGQSLYQNLRAGFYACCRRTNPVDLDYSNL